MCVWPNKNHAQQKFYWPHLGGEAADLTYVIEKAPEDQWRCLLKGPVYGVDGEYYKF